jgi:tellurite resistance-related uncharacterized protein
MADDEEPQRQVPATELPPGLESYRRTDVFSEQTIPSGLLRAHATKAGTWGLIQVAEGELSYRIEDERRVPVERRLRAGAPPGVVEPTILHSVEPVGRVRFRVEFFRAATQPR